MFAPGGCTVTDPAPRIEIDGRPAGADALHVLTLGGYGHFTAMQVRGGRTRGLDLHLRRLDAANREMFDRPLDGDLVRARVRHALGGEDLDASVRVYVCMPGAEPSILVTVKAPGLPADAPQRLRSVAYQRPVAHIKHSSGFAQDHYRRLARRDGFDEVLFTGADGVVSEGGTTNVALVDGSAVVWPDAPALHGITMQLLERDLPAHGIASRRGRVRLDDVAAFDGALLTNARGVVAVGSVDGRALPVPEAFVRTVTALYAAVPWDRI
jgi:branched-subunit amino acid aminotransferase/4-amino-4-deoxychorismate lyase